MAPFFYTSGGMDHMNAGAMRRLRRMRAPRLVRVALRWIAERALQGTRGHQNGSESFARQHQAILTSFGTGYMEGLEAIDEGAAVAALDEVDIVFRGFLKARRWRWRASTLWFQIGRRG